MIKFSFILRVSRSTESVVEYQPARNDVSAENEESPLLESLTRKRLEKAD
jgi:hypothetical protein